MIRIAINGFGRIGRTFLRTILLDTAAAKKIQVVAINVGPGELESTAYMFKYDTLMGTFAQKIEQKGSKLHVGNHTIQLISVCEPAKCPWKKLKIDWVVECSGRFCDRNGAHGHLNAGAHAVLISAPAHGEDVTIIPGVNNALFNSKKHKIVSLGSCTTNAFLPMLKVLDTHFGIQQGYMTTVHAYTNSQVLLDVECKDLRRSRAAALNIIPTTTGASRVMGVVMPQLKGKIHAIALRVPVGKGSLIDLTFTAQKKMTAKAINAAFLTASKSDLKGILDISHDPIVSSDSNNTQFSVIIDGLLTDANQHMAKVCGWYDNEWGYSERLKDFLVRIV